MPRLDGLSALERIVAEYSLPVDVVPKPRREHRRRFKHCKRKANDFIEKPRLQL
jgi:chemotaxis response regulator CheB